MIQGSPDIEVTVVIALSDRATQIAVRLPPGATVTDALVRSGLAARHPEVDLASARVGIFGKLTDRHAILVDGDRVEVYRALIADPKEQRQRRATAGTRLKSS
jgi:uncharacterized protein